MKDPLPKLEKKASVIIDVIPDNDAEDTVMESNAPRLRSGYILIGPSCR